jgi:hypothetical protein
MWFPDMNQIKYGRQGSYFKSLFIGLTAPILLLPQLVLVTFLFPILRTLFRATFLLIVGIFVLLILTPVLGVFGQVCGMNPTPNANGEKMS